MVKEFISQLPPDKLSPFAKHPYRVREDAAMDEMVESIRVPVTYTHLTLPKRDLVMISVVARSYHISHSAKL